MSRAGIQSNRGDGYQTLVAFGLALTVLSDAEYEWLEVDSVRWLVDDAVIGKKDGVVICCQCKKNQARHSAWTISDLEDELVKAIKLTNRDSKALIRFYSRSNFGHISALKEFSKNYPEKDLYEKSLTQAHKKTNQSLDALLKKNYSSLSTFEFLKRLDFEVTPSLDRMREIIKERLRSLVSNASFAFDTLFSKLSYLAMREERTETGVACPHRLTKEDIVTELEDCGALLTPPIDEQEIRSFISDISAIGRSWKRDIAGQRISSDTVTDLVHAIDAQHQSILLTGTPGAGKTCVMLTLQEELEKKSGELSSPVPVFIQTREFSDTSTVKERQSIGLPSNWVEKLSRISEKHRVVVLLDSLDVLSISREHKILDYFLAQIDRLMQLRNITVVTACRDFDRKYDKRIAQRTWGKLVSCLPLSWEQDVKPLLDKLGINSVVIDDTTRKLISNPRELVLYVELAARNGSFDVINSQSLAQKYLTTIVEEDDALGQSAIEALESMAATMLKNRSLAIPVQQFTSTRDIQRRLLSNQVLLENKNGQLTFGHQTLLDVLVNNRAIRRGLTLYQFIQELPAVPFVRPSIRSFTSLTASGCRKDFRKQIRKVLQSDLPFHIHRLVAESFVELPPEDNDWPLLRDLREEYRDIFHIIYSKAHKVKWCQFWFKYLVPYLWDLDDKEALRAHAERSSIWIDTEPEKVSSYWNEVFMQEVLEPERFAVLVTSAVTQAKESNVSAFIPLLRKTIKLRNLQYNFLGEALARSIKLNYLSDNELWSYISGDLDSRDILHYRLNDKLRCGPSEFGSKSNDFLESRMIESSELLSLAITAIESWSFEQQDAYSSGISLREGFLGFTSYEKEHSQQDMQGYESINILFDAIESAIKNNAELNTTWWVSNSVRLSQSCEGSLRYFAVLALTLYPTRNIDVISQTVCRDDILYSNLDYELGNLIKSSFVALDPKIQDKLQSQILNLYEEHSCKEDLDYWVVSKTAQLLLAIPCHFRLESSKQILSKYETSAWPLLREPSIRLKGGVVRAPFPFNQFLQLSDKSVVRLLEHYEKEPNTHIWDELLVGGKSEVGHQLREAVSRAPNRFLNLLNDKWNKVPEVFRDDIMSGLARHIEGLYGNLGLNDNWKPIELPTPQQLASRIIKELKHHSSYWRHNRAASEALRSCSHVIEGRTNILLFSLLLNEYLTYEENFEQSNLIVDGLNMRKGKAAEAAVILAIRLSDKEIIVPSELENLLVEFSKDKLPGVRAIVLRRLPNLQASNQKLGWDLFSYIMSDSKDELWSIAEKCLYHSYYRNPQLVTPWLEFILDRYNGKALETWARISALAALSNKIEFSAFLEKLSELESVDAWSGALSVWTHPENAKANRDQCFKGIAEATQDETEDAKLNARKLQNLFQADKPIVEIPLELLERYFHLLESQNNNDRPNMFGVEEWLNALSMKNPHYCVKAMNIFIEYVNRTRYPLYGHHNNITQLLTRLFGVAEEYEESDNGIMLGQVITMQDSLLKIGVKGIYEWLEAAERP
ncbi:MAG: AAA family ATPase [Idiomarina sp.]